MDGEVAPDQVESLRENDDVDVCIVDIRNPSSFAHGHIPDSLNVPLPELTARIEGLPDVDRVVTVCPHGKSSVQAARLIASYEGVDAPVESMAGGLVAYDGPLASGIASTDGGRDATDGGRDATDDGHDATDDGRDATENEGPDAPF